MIVWKNKVISRNFISDFGASIKNIVGGRLKTYEKMVDLAIKEATDELITEFPRVKNIKMQITEFHNASICCVVYGEVV